MALDFSYLKKPSEYGDLKGVSVDRALTAQEVHNNFIRIQNHVSEDGTLAGDSDEVVPTEKAIKAYVDGTDSPTVKLTGDQYIEGIKTFISLSGQVGAGESPLATNPNESKAGEGTTSTSFVTSGSFTSGFSGSVRMEGWHSLNTDSGTGYTELRFLKNGVVQQTWSIRTTVPTKRTRDISVVFGDVLTWQHRSTQGHTSVWSILKDRYIKVGSAPSFLPIITT